MGFKTQQTSPEVQNRGSMGFSKRTDVLQNFREGGTAHTPGMRSPFPILSMAALTIDLEN